MKAEDFLSQGIKPVEENLPSGGVSAETFLGMPTKEPVEKPVTGTSPAQEGQPLSMLGRGKQTVADFFRPSFAPEPTGPAGMEGMPESAIPAGMEMDIPGRRDAINTRLGQISAGATTDSIDSLQAQLEGITSQAVDGALLPDLYEQYTALRPQYEQAVDAYNAQVTEAQELRGELQDLEQQEYGAEMMRPISTVTGEPVPTFEEEAAGGRAAMAIVPYGFASVVRGLVPGALERAVMDPITKTVVGKEYVSPIDEALKIGKYLPEAGQMAIGAPAHMAGMVVPLRASSQLAGALMEAVGLPLNLVLKTGPVMDRITGHIIHGGLTGAAYGALEAGTPKGMAEDAAFFGALEGGLGAVGGIFRKIFSANWYRSLEVKERGLVVQSLDDMLDRGYSEGEILKKWNNPMWRAEALARRVVGEPPVKPAAPDLSEVQRDLAKEVIREEAAKSPAWETVAGGEGIDVMSRVPAIPEGQIPLVPPGMPPSAGPLPTEPAPGVLPPGQQGFELVEPMPEVRLRTGPRPRRGPEYPGDAEYVAGRAAPEELEVEYKPMLRAGGVPWKTEDGAVSALESGEDISHATHKVIAVEGGFGIVPLADKGPRVTRKAKPEEVKGKTLIAFVRAMGGIKDVTLPGEIRALSGKETGVVGLTTSRPEKGLGFDEMASAAAEHGWLPEGLEDKAGAFSGLLRDDIFAQKEKKPRIERLEDIAERTEREERWGEFERSEDEELEYFAKHPDKEIDADLDEWQREAVTEIRRRNEADSARKIEESVKREVEAKNSDLEGLKKDEGFPEYIEGWDEKDLLDEEALAELEAWRAGEEVPEKPVGEVPPAEPEILPEVSEKPKAEKKIPAEPVKPEAIEIPEFKLTEDALAFGKTATPKQVEALKAKKDESQAKSNALRDKGDLQGAMDEAVKGQLFREAIDSAGGKVVKPPEPKPEEPVVEAPVKEPWEMGKKDKVIGPDPGGERQKIYDMLNKELTDLQVKGISKGISVRVTQANAIEHLKLDGMIERYPEVVKRALGFLPELSPEAQRMELISKYLKEGISRKEAGEKADVELAVSRELLSETKFRLLENIKSEKGSSELINDLSRLGADAMRRGYTTYKAFTAEMKTELSSVWEKIKSLIRKAYFAAKKILKSERGAVEIGKPKPEAEYGRTVEVLKTATKEVKGTWDDIKKMADEYLGAISTRLANIDPSLRAHLRSFEYKAGTTKGKRIRQVQPLLEKIKNMSKEDKATFDLARKNANAKILQRLIIKYNLGKEYKAMRFLLNKMYSEAKGVGYKTGYREHFHPRAIKDPKGFLEYLMDKEDWPLMDKAIKAREVQLGRYLEEDEKAQVINSLLRGFGRDKIMLSIPGQLKERAIKTIWPELNKFYMDSDAALLRYIGVVTDAIEARKVFGVKSRNKKATSGTLENDINDTIGHYVLDLLAKGKIRPDQEHILREIYQARFNEIGTRGVVGLYKNLSYIDTMGSPISAITQIGDLAWALYRAGIPKTFEATWKAVAGKSALKKEDLGIERIAQEFADTSKMARAVTKVFKVIGLEKIDNIGKEALINAALKKVQGRAKNPKKINALWKELEPIFGQETDALIDDFQKDRISENVKLYLFNTLLDFQPVALSEMPEKYLTGGNGRIFYMLKTFTLKQFDIYRREISQQIRQPGTRLKGLKNLITLAACFVAANASADIIKSLILNRPIDFDDLTVDNLLRLLGISKFVTWKARQEGVGSATVRQVAPPFKLMDALSKDIMRAGDEKGLETVSSIPVLGKLYYWWFGRGAEKSERRRKKLELKKKPGGLKKSRLKGGLSGGKLSGSLK